MVLGQLEFTDETPALLCDRLSSAGGHRAILLGGADINTAFFKAGLINEIWITIEPVVFGKGNAFVLSQKLDVPLRLTQVKRLNRVGTLLLKYRVLSPSR